MWRQKGYEDKEQRICDQVRALKKNGWLSSIEVAKIKERVISGGCSGAEERCSLDGGGESVSVDVVEQNEVVVEARVQGRVCGGDGSQGISGDESVPEELKALCREIIEVVKDGTTECRFDFKAVDRIRMDKCVQTVNAALQYVDSYSITDTNVLLRAGSIVVARKLGLRNLAECSGDQGKERRNHGGSVG